MSSPTPLVGRAAELAVLRAELARVRRGELRCVLLTSQAGMGKTRLATELLASPAVTALSARAYPLGGESAFGLLAEALERHLRALPREDVARLCDGAAVDLAPLLRAVAAATGRVDLPEPPRPRVLAALAVLLGNLAGRRPVVLLLDDVHLADASSTEALHYLAHSCARSPVLVLLAARPDELAARPVARTVLAGLEQDGVLVRLPIRALDPAGVAELASSLLGRPAPGALASWLHERSRGNPLYAIGLVRALLDEEADLTAPVLHRLPEALAERVAIRVDALDPRDADAVERLAVLGRRTELRTLVAVVAASPDALTGSLERLVRTGLVTEHEQGLELTYELTHPLVAEAVYQRIGAARRRLLHRQVGRALRAAGAPGRAAAHYVRSAASGDDEAIEVLCDAARHAEQTEAYQEALPVLAALTELLPPGDPRWRGVVGALRFDAPWVLDHRADRLTTLGVDALRAMDRTMEAVADAAPRAGLKLRLANFLAWGDGGLAEAEQLCREARLLFGHAGVRRGVLLAEHELAFVRGLQGHLSEMQTGVERVVLGAREADDRAVLARALRTLDQVALWRGDLAVATAANDELLGLARAAGDRHREALALTSRAGIRGEQGRIADGLAAVDEADAVGADPRATGPHRIMLWCTAGEFRTALAVARELWRDTDGFARRELAGLAHAALAAAEHGELAAARRYHRAAERVLGGRDWAPASFAVRFAGAFCTWREGRGEQALPGLRDIVTRTLDAGAPALAAPWVVEWAELAAGLGQPDPGAVAAMEGVAARTGSPVHRALADLARAWTRRGAGDRPGTRAAAARTAREMDRCGWPIYVARARFLQGWGEPDRERAVTLLRAAAETFDACGALVRRDAALEALGRRGSRGRRAAAAAAGPGSLTPREREVAGLAAAGLPAREIGAALFIGERTVEGHLARVYARLGVRSKVELARRAAEFGLDGAGSRTGARTFPPDPDPGEP